MPGGGFLAGGPKLGPHQTKLPPARPAVYTSRRPPPPPRPRRGGPPESRTAADDGRGASQGPPARTPARTHAAAGARYGAAPTRPQQPARARAAARLSRRGLSGDTAEGLRARGLPPGVLREGGRGWERPRGSSGTAAAAAGARRGCSRRRARRQRRLSLKQTREIQIQVEIEIEKDYNSVETSKATSKSVRHVTGDTVLGCAPLHLFLGGFGCARLDFVILFYSFNVCSVVF